MNKKWLLCILIVSFFLLSVQKTYELSSLGSFFRADKSIVLEHFQKARLRVSKEDLELLKLWESILTGRSAPLSKWLKERYKQLGLNHLFTPSGFHISAVLFPFMKLLKKNLHQFLLLLLLGFSLCFLPGLSALKRMILIKGHQKVLGLHSGFILALVIDVLFGSFQKGALSFTYSFLFIGIIYSGLQGLGLIVWFFIAQMLLAYFQGQDISPLLIFFSPVVNLAFGIAMPVLFLFSFPLWDWQLILGISILKLLQYPIDLFVTVSQFVPRWEIHTGTILFIGLVLFKRWKFSILVLCLLSFSLNLDRQRNPSLPKEFVSRGITLKTIYTDKEIKIYKSDGICKMKLVRGFWWENCSPRRESSRKKLKKLSYPS